MRPLHSTRGLARGAVVFRDVRLGAAVDALLDRPLQRLVGFEVRCGDGAHRFLPFPACDVHDDHLRIESALVLLDRDLDFYRLGGSAFSDLAGEPIEVHGNEVGPLVDLLLTGEGDVCRVVASTPGGMVELEPGPGLVVGNQFLRPAV